MCNQSWWLLGLWLSPGLMGKLWNASCRATSTAPWSRTWSLSPSPRTTTGPSRWPHSPQSGAAAPGASCLIQRQPHLSAGAGGGELWLDRQRRQQGRSDRVLRSLVWPLQEPGAQIQGAGREGESSWSRVHLLNSQLKLALFCCCSLPTIQTSLSPRWMPPPTTFRLRMMSEGMWGSLQLVFNLSMLRRLGFGWWRKLSVADLVKSLFRRLLLQRLVQVFLNISFIFFSLSFSFPTIYFSPAGQKMNPKKYEASFFNTTCLDISFKTLAFPVWVLILPAVKLLF